MFTDVVIANKSYTKFTVSEDEALDKIALRVMKQDCPTFLMPIKTMEIDGELEIRYELTGGMRLAYASREMSKKEFYSMFINMLLPFKNCSDWFLDYHYILLDENYILVDKGGQAVRYIYLPVASHSNTDAQIRDFFMNLILRTTVMDDRGCMVEPLRIINSGDSNLMVLLDYFQKQTGPAQSQPEPAPVPVQQKEVRREQPPVQQAYQAPAAEENKNGGQKGGWGGFKWSSEKQTKQSQPEPARKEEAPADNRAGSAPGSRPGAEPLAFGQNDDQGKLISSLFDDSDDEDTKKKKKKEKPEKPKKEKHEKQEKQEKQGGGGFLGLFKGKQKEEADAQPDFFASQASGAQQYKPYQQQPYQQQPYQQQPYQQQPPYQQSGNNNGFGGYGFASSGMASAGDDGGDTIIGGGGAEERDPRMFCLRLEAADGCTAPRVIELDLSKGFATVGRISKTGESQADFCFDMSLSFVGRRHFRIEPEMDHWRIIDLQSGNGTYVNGKRIVPNMPEPLQINDVVMITYNNERRIVYRVC